MKRLLLGVTLLSVLPAGALAQSAAREPAVLELLPSARAAGLGGAYQVGQPDPDAIFVNPALIARASGFRLGYQRYAETSGSFSLSAATDWMGADVAVGLQTLEYGSLGPTRREGGIGPLVAGGPIGASETAATLAYARSVGPVTAGVGAKLIAQRFGAKRSTAASFDFGVSTNVDRFWVSLAARNLGPRYDFGDVEVTTPEQFSAGIGTYGYQAGPLDLGVAGNVYRRADGEWSGGGGLEVGYYPVNGRTFIARVGGTRVVEDELSPLTLGASYWGDTLVMDYAFHPHDRSGGIHRFTLGWR
jgi:hypothetical protein